MSILRGKVVVVGDATVGKTAIVNQLVHQNFINSYQMTQACEYKIKEIPVPDSKTIVELHILDVAGQKIFNSIAIDLIKDVHMCVLVYDVTQPDTFASLQSWYEGIRDENGKDIPGILIGNKTDLGRA
jgi:small GTP-binding protein